MYTVLTTLLVRSFALRYSSLNDVLPVAWLVEMFGPSSSEKDTEDFFHRSAQNGSGSVSGGRNGPGVGSKGGCVHEDGGRFATFESTAGDPVSGECCVCVCVCVDCRVLCVCDVCAVGSVVCSVLFGVLFDVVCALCCLVCCVLSVV